MRINNNSKKEPKEVEQSRHYKTYQTVSSETKLQVRGGVGGSNQGMGIESKFDKRREIEMKENKCPDESEGRK